MELRFKRISAWKDSARKQTGDKTAHILKCIPYILHKHVDIS